MKKRVVIISIMVTLAICLMGCTDNKKMKNGETNKINTAKKIVKNLTVNEILNSRIISSYSLDKGITGIIYYNNNRIVCSFVDIGNKKVEGTLDKLFLSEETKIEAYKKGYVIYSYGKAYVINKKIEIIKEIDMTGKVNLMEARTFVVLPLKNKIYALITEENNDNNISKLVTYDLDVKNKTIIKVFNQHKIGIENFDDMFNLKTSVDNRYLYFIGTYFDSLKDNSEALNAVGVYDVEKKNFKLVNTTAQELEVYGTKAYCDESALGYDEITGTIRTIDKNGNGGNIIFEDKYESACVRFSDDYNYIITYLDEDISPLIKGDSSVIKIYAADSVKKKCEKKLKHKYFSFIFCEKNNTIYGFRYGKFTEENGYEVKMDKINV